MHKPHMHMHTHFSAFYLCVISDVQCYVASHVSMVLFFVAVDLVIVRY
jgi:hypothetical protein